MGLPPQNLIKKAVKIDWKSSTCCVAQSAGVVEYTDSAEG